MTTTLGIVSGTVNRLSHLQAMVKSVGAAIPTGISYIITVVDGGSTDGTQDWCKAQADIALVEQGERLGAIKAFDAGAEATDAEYILLANDDIVLEPQSIMRALSHIESHPRCGAVAFADDRRAPGYDTDAFKVQTITAFADADMTHQVAVPYPQVGLVRKWLGDACGWWGSRDPRFQPSHTYGGDSRLGAEIWQHGYTVDAVEGANVRDLVAPDSLRDANYKVEQSIGSAYYRAYPRGPLIRSTPTIPNSQTERLRVLYLPLYEPHFGAYKSGLRQALSKVALTYEWDYLSSPGNLASIMDAFQPHVVLTQFHAAEPPFNELMDARRYAPGAVVCNWNGDIYPEHLTSPDMLEMLHSVDLQLVVNADVLDVYQAQGIPAAYWQVSFEPVDEAHLPPAAVHDVLFLANANNDGRGKLGRVLRRLPCNVGIYGNGWPDANGRTLYDFAAGRALYRNAKLAISDNQHTGKAFVSNRLFEALASGVCVLQQRVPGLEELTGLTPGKHYVEYTDNRDVERKVSYYLSHEAERLAIGAAGREFCMREHSFDARVKELFERLLPMAAEKREVQHV